MTRPISNKDETSEWPFLWSVNQCLLHSVYLGHQHLMLMFTVFETWICSNQFHFTSSDTGFDSYQIFLNTTKLQKRCRPASEQEKVLSNIKTDSFVNFTYSFQWQCQSSKCDLGIRQKPAKLHGNHGPRRTIQQCELRK